MTADRQYLDPAVPPLPGGRYDRSEVLKADRWAWAGDVNGQRVGYFYDGFDFWRQLRGGQRQAVSRLHAPASGWWHKPACNCPLCSGRAEHSSALQGTMERP